MARKNYKNKPAKHVHFRMSPMNICQSKKAYKTESEAQASIGYQQKLNPDLKLKTYYCPDCQKWHLTTKKHF